MTDHRITSDRSDEVPDSLERLARLYAALPKPIRENIARMRATKGTLSVHLDRPDASHCRAIAAAVDTDHEPCVQIFGPDEQLIFDTTEGDGTGSPWRGEIAKPDRAE